MATPALVLLLLTTVTPQQLQPSPVEQTWVGGVLREVLGGGCPGSGQDWTVFPPPWVPRPACPAQPCHPVRVCPSCTHTSTTVQCKDGSSNLTLYGGPATCKSDCHWSEADGFSLCDLITPLYRDGRWHDWDLCSLCKTSKQDLGSTNDQFLTPYGNICDADSPCWNKWNNYEVKGARCRVTVGGIANLDWCTRPTKP